MTCQAKPWAQLNNVLIPWHIIFFQYLVISRLILYIILCMGVSDFQYNFAVEFFAKICADLEWVILPSLLLESRSNASAREWSVT